MNTLGTRIILGGGALVTMLAFPLFGIVACSGSDSTGDDGISAEQASTDLSNQYCDKIEACAPVLIRVAYGDVATCKTRAKLGIQPALSANGSSATPSRFAACARDLQGATCEQILQRKVPESCKTQPGSLIDGAACGSDHQCQGRLCRKTGDASCGACSKLGAAGETCRAAEDCEYGLGCSAGNVCVAYAAAGVACDAGHPCSPDLACKSGTCGAPGAGGDDCQAPPAANTCNAIKGLYCGANGKCTETTFVGAGQTCGLPEGKPVGCNGAATCRMSGFTGTCQAPAADGATCRTDAQGPSCAAPARCVGGVCKLDDPNACK